MPITTNFSLPASADLLDLPNSVFFISFHASPDPKTGAPWCPDVVAAIPYLRETFAAQNVPEVAFIDVGERPEFVQNPRKFLILAD